MRYYRVWQVGTTVVYYQQAMTTLGAITIVARKHGLDAMTLTAEECI